MNISTFDTVREVVHMCSLVALGIVIFIAFLSIIRPSLLKIVFKEFSHRRYILASSVFISLLCGTVFIATQATYKTYDLTKSNTPSNEWTPGLSQQIEQNTQAPTSEQGQESNPKSTSSTTKPNAVTPQATQQTQTTSTSQTTPSVSAPTPPNTSAPVQTQTTPTTSPTQPSSSPAPAPAATPPPKNKCGILQVVCGLIGG